MDSQSRDTEQHRASNTGAGMTKEDEALIAICLREICSEDYIPEWEFSTVIGRSRSEVEETSARWPAAFNVDTDLDTIVNVILNLRGYPHGRDKELEGALGCRLSDFERLIECVESLRAYRGGHG